MRKFFVGEGDPFRESRATAAGALIPGDRPSRGRLMLDFAACLATTLLAGVGSVLA